MTETTVRTRWGSVLTVFAEDASHRGDFLTSGVSWAHETRVLHRLARRGMSVIDVGASFGYCSSLLAHRVGRRGRVLALEPDPVMFDLLSRNMAHNGHQNVTVLQAAAGAASGEAVLWHSATNMGRHSLTPELVPARIGSTRVRLHRLDDLCTTGSGFERVDLVKVDAEGAEAAVLRGGVGLLRRCRPALWLEFWPDGLGRSGHSPADLLRDLRRWGYALTMVDLLTGDWLPADGASPIEYCARMAEELVAAGETNLSGIVYLLARPA